MQAETMANEVIRRGPTMILEHDFAMDLHKILLEPLIPEHAMLFAPRTLANRLTIIFA